MTNNLKRIFCFYFAASLFCGSLAASSLNQHEGEHVGWGSMFGLPQQAIDQRFSDVQREIDERWHIIASNKTFPHYVAGQKDETLADEFYQLSNFRVRMWFQDHESLPCRSSSLFKVAQDLLLKGRFRQPNCLTFEHSMTDSSYNSSCIQIGTRRFLALEGPTKEHVTYFFRLLANWGVASVVCLTDETDSLGTPKCFPYWQDRMIQKENVQFLRIPIDGAYELSESSWGTKELPYLFWSDWEDHHGVEPKRLVKAIQQVRRTLSSDRDIIAVHCSAGVGRTGTFISAFCLLDAIDEQLEKGVAPNQIQLSIAKLFLYLNLHRPWLVAKPSQYITLYRTVEWYLNSRSV